MLGDLLKDLLRQANTSFIDIERDTGISRDSMSRFVNGQQTLRLDVADRLATYFGVRVLPPDESEAPFQRRRQAMADKPLQRLADEITATRPGLAPEVAGDYFFNIGSKVEANVWIQGLYRKSPSPRLVVGMAFDTNCRDVNDRTAGRFVTFLEERRPPEPLGLNSPGKVVYYNASFPLSDPLAVKRAAALAVWLADQPFAVAI